MKICDLFGSAPGSALLAADLDSAAVAEEHRAFILVNEQPVFQVVCTPSLLPELALGRLLTEGIITSAAEVAEVNVCAEGRKLRVTLTHPISVTGETPEVPTCCTDNLTLAVPAGRAPLRTVSQRAIPDEWVFILARAMSAGLPLYHETHSAHCALLLYQGAVAAQAEDLGRHNALDKVIGLALRQGLPLEDCVLFTSGRMPVDMVRKAIRAGVPALVSKTLPTAQGVELAQEYGLTLIAKAGTSGILRFG